MKKIVFFDADGTIMDIKRGVPESAKKALRKLTCNGNDAFLCTGRAFSFVPETKQRQPPQAEGKKRKAGTGTEDFCGTATGPGIIQADLEKIGRQERRDAYLRMGIDRKNKLTFLWLTEEENTDRIWKENVLAQAGVLAEKGSRAVVFISGHKDLFPLMEGLVKHNAGMLK